MTEEFSRKEVTGESLSIFGWFEIELDNETAVELCILGTVVLVGVESQGSSDDLVLGRKEETKGA